MSALLALLQHREAGVIVIGTRLLQDIDSQINNASSWVGKKLKRWTVDATDHVCFEMLVPLHLRLLHVFGFEFQFQGYPLLMELHAKKTAKFNTNMAYKAKGTFFHSLEAFIGVIDFDKMKAQLKNGSCMSSPLLI